MRIPNRERVARMTNTFGGNLGSGKTLASGRPSLSFFFLFRFYVCCNIVGYNKLMFISFILTLRCSTRRLSLERSLSTIVQASRKYVATACGSSAAKFIPGVGSTPFSLENRLSMMATLGSVYQHGGTSALLEKTNPLGFWAFYWKEHILFGSWRCCRGPKRRRVTISEGSEDGCRSQAA